jgi:bifunctional non-homologous end joining protein LigD
METRPKETIPDPIDRAGITFIITFPFKMPKKLDSYDAKRSPERTPEPFAGDGIERPRLFVVQKHAARRLHYDLRLEMGGVLHSWAVPRGPSLDPAEKRLAVEVEDHPVEYADFEGMIPAGNYGAGAVIVWDRGAWTPVEDPADGLKKGKLLFDLAGYKLRGRWTLVRTKNSVKDWLLIKKPDAWARGGADGALGEESILSGLGVEELRDGKTRADEVRAELERLGAPRRRVAADDVQVMLAETADAPFSRDGWLFELKYDGFRLLAAREGGRARLFYRRGNDSTAVFPDVARALRTLPYDAILDGEVVVLDGEGRPSFSRLQKRVLLTRAADIERAAVELPATLFLFDLVGFEDFDLRGLPLVERKRLLARLLPRTGPLRYADHVATDGQALFDKVRARGLEGVMAKRADSPYRAGRSADWLKVRAARSDDFVIVGYTRPKGGRTGLGALLLAQYDGGRLVYVGRAGSGLGQAQLVELAATLDGMRRAKPPCEGTRAMIIGAPRLRRNEGALPPAREAVWAEPRLVCEVRYTEITDDGLLRQPTFLRLRDDKPAADCVRAGEHAPPPAPSAVAPERRVPLSNLDKVFWPDDGYTKGDLIDFYRAIAPWMLPYLRDRPIVVTRFPDGISGKSFFQHDAPAFVPGWIRTERRYSDHQQREIDYFVVDDQETLLYLANLGVIPIHAWASRVATLESPDWCVIDLDPKEAPFSAVVEVARAVRAVCDDIELPSYVKTSGSTGLHVLVPLGGLCSHDDSRMLAQLIAHVVATQLPEIATVERVISARGRRVYLDCFQNGQGRTIVAPFSVRPLPGAPLSTPLTWREVNAKLDPRRHTIKTVVARMEKLERDPLRPLLDEKPDLARALAKLESRIDKD